jgi:eukaryotic-like serine/threonine-protein kinase
MTRVYGFRTRSDYRPSPSGDIVGQGHVENAEHIVANRYRLRDQLGRGGMGIVWRAHDERLGREVALKVLHPWVADDAELRARFEREAAALARLEHPNIVRLYDVLEDRGQTVLVLELVEGQGLHAVVAGRTLSWDESRRLCAPVAAALAHAHARGVVHRDLTPSNVLVERGSGRVVVTDFGLARLVRGATTAPVSGVLAGTPEYWAPEQASGAETGPATDLYSLGCILFQLLSGRLPFEGEDRLATGLRRAHEPAPSLGTVAPQAPVEAVRIVDVLLARQPAVRGDATAAALALGADPASLPGRADTTPTTVVRGPAPTLVTRVLREPVTIIQRVRSHRPVPRARIAAVALLLAAVIGLAGGVFAVAGGDPAGVKAPDVVGTKVGPARTALAESAHDAELPVPKLKVVDRSYSESAPAGAIIAQDPPEGDRITGNGALLVSVSRGTAYADVPSVTGLTGAAAYALLERRGFTPSRSYAPSMEIEAWHALETEPATGTSVKRPARVQLVVSTGPPKRPVPTLRGLDVNAASEALRDAGFTPVVEERPSATSEPGALLAVRPRPGARIPLGSTVTLVVARAPRWEILSRVEGTEDAEPAPFVVPRGARLVLTTVDTSPLGLWGGKVRVRVAGDSSGEAEVAAGEWIVLADPSDGERTIEVEVDVDGSAHWTLAVEVPR